MRAINHNYNFTSYDSLLYSYFSGGYFNGKGGVHFMHRDYQGSVILVTDSAGTVEQHTNYFPYGEPFSEPSGQPYLFSGKERLSRSKYTDFGPRHLSTASLLWSAPDKLVGNYRQISPYTYCAANPILFRDPTGKKIEIAATVSNEDLWAIMFNLMQLTDDKIVFKTQKDGSRRVKIAELGTGNKPVGTSLIRALNSSDKTVTIDSKESSLEKKTKNQERNYTRQAEGESKENKTNGAGVNTYVNFNKDFNPKISVINSDNKRLRENRPAYIGLGHELIHDWGYIKGSAAPYGQKSNNPYTNMLESTNELMTIGIIGNNEYTENALREEHGLPLRYSHK